MTLNNLHRETCFSNTVTDLPPISGGKSSCREGVQDVSVTCLQSKCTFQQEIKVFWAMSSQNIYTLNIPLNRRMLLMSLWSTSFDSVL